MANEIKLKRGSGSDPGASDLVVGELAIRTDNGKLFTKKDDNSVAEITGGGGIDDGDKGDITVSNSGATFTIDNGVVTYAKIQNVSATNRILGRDSSGAGDIEEITPANLRTMLNVADGATNVTNNNQLTNGAGYITATLTNEQVQDIVGGMVSGNTETGITVTYQDGDGTLDFVVGTLNQDTTGNAATATALETARTIGGTSFDGTANITPANATNADTVDSLHASSFIRSDADDSYSGTITADSDGTNPVLKIQGSGPNFIQFASDASGTVDADSINFIYRSGDNTLRYERASDDTSLFQVDADDAAATFSGAVTASGGFVGDLTGDVTGNATTADGVDVSGVTTNAALRVLFTTNDAGAGRTIGCDSSDDKFTYNPSSNTLTVDTVVAALTGNVTGNASGSSGSCTGNAATATSLETARTIAGVSFDGTANISLNNNAITNGAGYITATLTNEQVQDIVGGMVSGNTESGITVTYQDSDGTLDFSVASQTDQNFTTTLKNKLDGIAAGATVGLPTSGGELTGDLITHVVKPDGNNTRTLGTSSARWSDVFTNDLHLSNKGGSNKVDNTWGDFTIQEGIEDLFLINNRNGKMYKFMLKEVG